VGSRYCHVSRPVSEIVFVALAAACHGVSAALYLLERGSLGLPAEWDLQYFALLSFSLVLSALAALWRGDARSKAAVAFAFLCYVLIGYPLPASSGIQIVLGMPLMIAVVAFFPRPDYLIVGAAFLAATLLARRPSVVWGKETQGAEPSQLILLAVILVFVFSLGIALKEIAESRRRTVAEMRRLDSAIDRIADVNASFQSALAAAEEDSVRKERNRITREIHDIVGYALTNQQMMLEAALMLTPVEGGRLRELLAMARDGVGEGLRETRKTLYALRRVDEQKSPDFGVILKVARNFETVTGVKVTVDFTNARGELDAGVWMSLYRLIQESMINAFRHGKARNISIIFREDRDTFNVLVRDDGVGAPDMVEGIGLKGMRERAAALGGEFEAGNSVDGFMVSARFPKRKDEEALP
jgi:signal transduction histidine kinase